MAEYINREAIMKFPIRKDHCDKEHANEHFINGIESVLEYVENLPAADVAPVRHGRWVHTDLASHWLGKDECSECTYHKKDRSDLSHNNYCPYCGAKMDLEG